MRDRPDGTELLRQARATLLEDLLPGLPEDRRYEALMVASAMAIAARELAFREDREAERDALETILRAAAGQDIAQALDSLLRRLAAEIREGKQDRDAEVHDLLLRDAELEHEVLVLTPPTRWRAA